jgi:hypothetical protein
MHKPPPKVDPNEPTSLELDSVKSMIKEDALLSRGLANLGLTEKEQQLAVELSNLHQQHFVRAHQIIKAGVTRGAIMLKTALWSRSSQPPLQFSPARADKLALGRRPLFLLRAQITCRMNGWKRMTIAPPQAQGLYDPRNEHDSCGVGFIANVKGRKSNAIIAQGLQILINLDHRGAVGADPMLGDGAGVLIQIPDALFRHWANETGVELPAPGSYAVAMCFLPRDAASRTSSLFGVLLVLLHLFHVHGSWRI